MKCLKCGYVTSESREVCARCGSPLPVRGSARTPVSPVRPATPATPAPPPPPPQQATPSTVTPVEPLPDWRKEVSRKVKDYTEKKRILTTPPNPLKPHEAASAATEPEIPDAAPEPPRPKVMPSFLNRVEPSDPPPPEPQPRVYAPPPPVEPVPETPAPPRQPLTEPRTVRQIPSFDEEIFAEDLSEDMFTEEEDVPQQEHLYLGRRTAALVVDSMILIILHAGLLYLCSEIISYRFRDLLIDEWLPLSGIFLLFHCLYYAYFYKTSRQTPGQVFFKLELRDPESGQIAMGKILLRWLCLVVLNVLNVAPALLGRGFLILDRASGTVIRTLK